MYRTCTICGEAKILGEFHKNKSSPDGHYSICKVCTVPRRKKRHLRNRDKENAQNCLYRNQNRERAAEYARFWQKNNPEKVRTISRNYKARKRNSKGTHTVEEFEALIEYYGHFCLCCGVADKLTADHVVPLSWGGSNSIENLQPLCCRCNSAKNNLHATDYRPDKGIFAHRLKESADCGNLR